MRYLPMSYYLWTYHQKSPKQQRLLPLPLAMLTQLTRNVLPCWLTFIVLGQYYGAFEEERQQHDYPVLDPAFCNIELPGKMYLQAQYLDCDN